MRTSNTNPIFIEKTKDGERIYDISSRLLKDRVIFLDSEIDQEVASNIVALLFLLDRESSEPISLWINSNGGILEGLFAIYDMMQRIKCPVKTICVGEACSAAAVLLAAGSKGIRFAMPNSRIMIHQIQINGMEGTNAEIEVSAKELKKLQSLLTETIARHTGNSVVKIKRDIKLDKYLSAKEAIEYGLIDKLLIPSKEIPELKKR